MDIKKKKKLLWNITTNGILNQENKLFLSLLPEFELEALAAEHGSLPMSYLEGTV